MRAAACLAMVVLSACADLQLDSSLITSTDVVFKRNPGFAGWDCKSAISIDGVLIKSLKINEVLHTTVLPGRHQIDAEASSGTCANFAATYYVKVNESAVIHVVVEAE